jgi:hypothetical protein
MKNKKKYLSYVAGLFDGGGSVYFRISSSNRDLGYRINPTVIIHLDKQDELYGFLDEFLVSERIQFKVSNTKSGFRRLEIDTRVNVERFLNLVREHSIQHTQSINFILDILYPARDCGKILDDKEFTRMVETIEFMQPRRRHNDSVKYTTDFFYNLWDLEEDLLPYDIPMDSDTLKNPDIKYLAGMFDGSGKIRPVIHESDSTDLGYSASLRLDMTRSWLRDKTLNMICDFLDKHNICYNMNHQDSRVSVHITHQECIESFILCIQEYLVANFEISRMTVEKIIPAFMDDYHKTRQGLHDIVALYEMVMDCNSERKYTSDFFMKQWDSIEPIGMDVSD